MLNLSEFSHNHHPSRVKLLAKNIRRGFPVMIWFKSPPGEDIASHQRRVFDYLISNYPKAAEFMEKYGKPLGIGNDPDSAFINQEYGRLMRQVVRSGAISNWFKSFTSQGFTVQDMYPMPALFAVLDAQHINELVIDPEVETIYLNEFKASPALFDAGISQRFPSIWNPGINGNGRP